MCCSIATCGCPCVLLFSDPVKTYGPIRKVKQSNSTNERITGTPTPSIPKSMNLASKLREFVGTFTHVHTFKLFVALCSTFAPLLSLSIPCSNLLQRKFLKLFHLQLTITDYPFKKYRSRFSKDFLLCLRFSYVFLLFPPWFKLMAFPSEVFHGFRSLQGNAPAS